MPPMHPHVYVFMHMYGMYTQFAYSCLLQTLTVQPLAILFHILSKLKNYIFADFALRFSSSLL